MGETRSLAAAVAGLVAVGIASGATWLYLSSITIDDGLEGLIFLPLLFVAAAVVSLPAGWKRTTLLWPLVCGGVAMTGAGAALVALDAIRNGGPNLVTSATLSVVMFFPIALAGALAGWASGLVLRSLVPADHPADVG